MWIFKVVRTKGETLQIEASEDDFCVWKPTPDHSLNKYQAKGENIVNIYTVLVYTRINNPCEISFKNIVAIITFLTETIQWLGS